MARRRPAGLGGLAPLILALPLASGRGSLRVTGPLARAPDVGSRLRVCNAYAPGRGGPVGLDVYVGGASRIRLPGEALAYASCRRFPEPLAPGDAVVFMDGEAQVGAFAMHPEEEAEGLPHEGKKTVLVVIHRDSNGKAAFESLVFGESKDAQVAIVDAYRGDALATPCLQTTTDNLYYDMLFEKNWTRRGAHCTLGYGAAATVHPGTYKLALVAPSGLPSTSASLVALEGESYAVVRVGEDSKAQPQELVVFPKSDPSMLAKDTGGTGRGAELSMLLAAGLVALTVVS